MKDSEFNDQQVDEQPVVDKPTAEQSVAAQSAIEQSTVAQPATSSRSSTIRKWFFYILIGGLIVSAVISIIAVLIGGINDIVGRSLWTTLIMVVHSLIAVSLLTTATNERNRMASEVSINVLVGLTIASFITAALGIWEVFTGVIVADLYKLIFYALIADMLVYGLLLSQFKDKAIALSAKASIGVTIVYFLYLIPSVFQESLSYTLPEVYGRGAAAFSILLSTLVVITVILHWIYNNKHRDELERERQAAKINEATGGNNGVQPMSGTMKAILIIIGVFVGLPILVSILSVMIDGLSNGF